MIHHANGTFTVKLTRENSSQQAAAAEVGRSSVEKQFHGDLEATSAGEMLSAVTKVKGSAGYVAIERVTGRLQGRSGTFVLQHSAVMVRGGTQQMLISVLPDSGTDELTGISGSMTIKVENGTHFFTFEYSLADNQ